MRNMLPLLVAATLVACGGKHSTTSPDPVPATNHPPEIVAATVTPAHGGWLWLTTFSVHAEARDPDGDAVTYSWKDRHGDAVAGTVTNGGADVAFTTSLDAPGNTSPLTLTVTDAKGNTVHTTVEFEDRVLGGKFVGHIGALAGFWFYPRQTRGVLTGDVLDPRDREDGIGTADPAQPGTIDAQGHFRIRFKYARDLGDLTLEGHVTDDFHLVGTATGSGLTGQAFELQQDDGY